MDRRSFLGVAAATAAFPSLLLDPANAVLPISRNSRASVIYKLPPSSTRRLAWTVDDGCSTDAVRKYTENCIEYNMRLTFFVYSGMSAWKANQELMQPLIDSGQIQLGNHTHMHHDLTRLSSAQIRREIWDCHNYLSDHFGVDARPYFRPPYGAWNHRVRQVAAELGYTKLMMWSGTLADSGHISLTREMYFSRRYMNNGAVLLGHANNMNASTLFPQLHRVATNRNLSMVTLRDAL